MIHSFPSHIPVRPRPGPWENTGLLPQGSVILVGRQHEDTLNHWISFANNTGCVLKVFTDIENMTALQTACWIWTIGYSHGWKEAMSYYESFIYNDIRGAYVKVLKSELLEDLGIQNHSHRNVILSAIRDLSRQTVSLYDSSINFGSFQSYRPESYTTTNTSFLEDLDSSYSKSLTKSYMESGSEYERTRGKAKFRWETKSSNSGWPLAMSVAAPRLILTKTDADEGRQILLEDIKRNFRDHDYDVEVESANSQLNRYTVTFHDKESAHRALNEAHKFGYHLEKRLEKRPKPNCPVKYRCLTRCRVREGKSQKSKPTVYLKINDTVLVNQLKNRRARLVKKQEDGTYKPYGWVTVHTKNGMRLLQQLDDDEV